MRDIYDRYEGLYMDEDDDAPENPADQGFMMGWCAADPFS